MTPLQHYTQWFGSKPDISASLPRLHNNNSKAFYKVTVSGLTYYLKFSDDPGGIPDINEREILGAAFAASLDFKTAEPVLIQSADISNSWLDGLKIPHWVIKSKFILMKDINGNTLKADPSRIKQNVMTHKLADFLIFAYWFGDEDRGTCDVLVDTQSEPYFIDFGLCGPGNPCPSRSCHPSALQYSACQLAELCNPNKISLALALHQQSGDIHALINNSKVSHAIKSFNDSDITDMVNESGIQNPKKIADCLIQRRDRLDFDLYQWQAQLKSCLP